MVARATVSDHVQIQPRDIQYLACRWGNLSNNTVPISHIGDKRTLKLEP
jgi:hypothetical protein